MKLSKTATLLTMALSLSGCVIHVDAQSADVHLQENLSLNGTDLKQLVVESGSGDLTIKGSAQAEEISVIANIETTEKRNYKLSLQKVGLKAVLVAEHDSTSGFWNGNSPEINLQVTVPEHLALSIEDGSGDIEVYDINNSVEIEDGSGDIVVQNIEGPLDVEDGSGDLKITNIRGDLAINDGSGEIWATDIGGSTDVDDGSGELSLRNISGVVTINDGSGDIEVINAGGLTITDSGSGDLTIEKVKGELNIDS